MRSRTIERRRRPDTRVRPRPQRRPEAVPARRKEDPRSLEEVVVSSWAELVATVRAQCPVCGFKTLTPSGCESCGAELR